MAQQNGTALDAINEALGVTGADEAADTSGAGESGDELIEDPPESDEPAPESEGEEGAAEGDAELDIDGKPARAADGRFAKKEAADAAAAAAAAKPALGPDGKPVAAAAKAPDPLNDPIPKEVAQATQDRIRTLIGMTREETKAREIIQTDFNYIVEGIKQTGASPQQYGETLSWLALFNSGDASQQEKALELVEGVAEQLATMLGKERKLSDPLSGHADLTAAVANGHTTRAIAVEMARTRNAANFRTRINTQAQQTAEQTQQAQQQELASAKTELNELEGVLKNADPLYARKKAALVPKLKAEFATIPPAQWAAKFRQMYKAVKVAPAARQQVPQNQPMRARSASGAQGAGGEMAKPAGTALDAINNALAGM